MAVLSYGLGQSAFAVDPSIVGRTITLSGRTYDVVGVMPPAFFFPGRDVQLWMPFGYTPQLMATSRRPHWLGVIARRRPGVSFEQARDDMFGESGCVARLSPELTGMPTFSGAVLGKKSQPSSIRRIHRPCNVLPT